MKKVLILELCFTKHQRLIKPFSYNAYRFSRFRATDTNYPNQIDFGISKAGLSIFT
jgi:hypothetical protein